MVKYLFLFHSLCHKLILAFCIVNNFLFIGIEIFGEETETVAKVIEISTEEGGTDIVQLDQNLVHLKRELEEIGMYSNSLCI